MFEARPPYGSKCSTDVVVVSPKIRSAFQATLMVWPVRNPSNDRVVLCTKQSLDHENLLQSPTLSTSHYGQFFLCCLIFFFLVFFVICLVSLFIRVFPNVINLDRNSFYILPFWKKALFLMIALKLLEEVKMLRSASCVPTLFPNLFFISKKYFIRLFANFRG